MVGHVVVINTVVWFEVDPVTHAVIMHPSKELNLYSTVVVANPKDDTLGCTNMYNVSRLLISQTAELSFNLVNEFGVPNKEGNGTQPKFRYLSFDASMWKVSYEKEEQDSLDKRTTELDEDEDDIENRKQKNLQKKIWASRAVLKNHKEATSANKKKRKVLKDKTNDKSQADSETTPLPTLLKMPPILPSHLTYPRMPVVVAASVGAAASVVTTSVVSTTVLTFKILFIHNVSLI